MAKSKREELIRKNEPQSFERYIAEFGKDAKALLATKEADIKASAITSSTDSGALNEKLTSSGLSGSGYEDYLKSRVELSTRARLDAARHESELAKLENRQGYARYLSHHDAVQEKLAEELTEKLSLEAVPNYEKMLSTALSAGLTEERAVSTAASAYEKASNYSVYKAIAFARKNDLTPLRAKQYALAIGLGEDLAERVYEATYTLSSDAAPSYQSVSAEEYIDYLIKRQNALTDYKTGTELENKTIEERTKNYYER